MNINRRTFLFGGTATAALAGCETNRVGLRPLTGNEKRRIAVIGCGIQMRSALLPQLLDKTINPNGVIIAACDCDKTRAADGAKMVNRAYGAEICKPVLDFRAVLADPTFDVVVIATPDHWHAYLSVEAMKHGKDVYCEKPMTFSIDEASKVIAAQKKYGRVFQNGSMQRSWPVFRTAVAIVRGGGIGDVRYVDANYGRGGQKLGGPSHPVRFWDVPENAKDECRPNPDCNWDMWLGPAQWRPYSDQLAPRGVNNFYPMFWRFDDDIGSGYNGDWGAHHLDIAQWGMDMDDSGPYKILASKEPHSEDLFHGGRRQFGMKMLFKSKKGSDIELYHGPFGVWGTVFYGTKGIVAVNRGKIAVWTTKGLVRPTLEIRRELDDGSYPGLVAAFIGKDYGTDSSDKKDDALANVLETLEKRFANEIKRANLYFSPNQMQNFLSCVESRQQTISPAEVGGRGAALCLLCNMAYKYDTDFDWDPVRMEIPGSNPKGISIRREVYRNGWDVIV